MTSITVAGGKGTVGLSTEDVLQLVWGQGTVLVADDVQAAMATINGIADGIEYPLLIDITHTKQVTPGAKSVFSTKCAASRIALLGTNPVSRVIANFAMARRSLPCPTKFFASRDEAMTWLLEASPS